jgi:hypothetical protein
VHRECADKLVVERDDRVANLEHVLSEEENRKTKAGKPESERK